MNNNVITVFELFETSGDELGRYSRNLGWFKTKGSAEKAALQLGHPFHKIEPRQALEVESGEVYILQYPDPVSFGLKRR